MNMNTLELAKSLGEAIKNDEILLNYDAAKETYEKNSELQEKLRVYNTQRAVLSEDFNKDIDTQNAETISKIKETMDSLGKEIVGYPEYKAFADAQKKVTDFMNTINRTITQYAFGIDPGSCTHDCSTCSGCSR